MRHIKSFRYLGVQFSGFPHPSTTSVLSMPQLARGSARDIAREIEERGSNEVAGCTSVVRAAAMLCARRVVAQESRMHGMRICKLAFAVERSPRAAGQHLDTRRIE